MITDKTVCRVQKLILYLTFLLWKFVETLLITFVDTISEVFII